MKKVVCILFALFIGIGIILAKDFVFKNCKICAGYGHEVVYTIRDNKVCSGLGHEVVYTIRGNEICDGYGHEVVYSIRE